MPKQEAWELPEAGKYNVAPQLFKPIAETDFAARFFTWSILKMEQRQLRRTYTGEPIESLTGVPPMEYMVTELFWHHNGMGFAIGKTWDKEPKLLFFRIGVCDHKWEELSQASARAKGIEHYGMFCHVYYCERCQRHYTTDSSD